MISPNRVRLLVTTATAAIMVLSAAAQHDRRTTYWKARGNWDLNRAIQSYTNLNTNLAKNVVLLVGDGMSLATTVAGRVKIGQSMRKKGEEHVTTFDSMPHVGLLKTYCVDHQTPDSASTATAILTGVKTRAGVIGIGPEALNCYASKNHRLMSALKLAIQQGKSVGIVTNTRVQHATPAAAYAHALYRTYYSDNDVPPPIRRAGCKDISQQLYDLRDKIQVVMGGGRAHMTLKRVGKLKHGCRVPGERTDGQDLIQMWKDDMLKRNGSYVATKWQLAAVDPSKTDYLMGLFADYELTYAVQRRFIGKNEPSLKEMIEKAVEILSKNSKGYFLLVESGLLDRGHHEGRATFALQEFHETDIALSTLRSLTSRNDTLLVATADHGHMFLFGGKAVRGNPVFGISSEKAADGLSYTTILYGNGPGHLKKRVNPPGYVARLKYYRPESAIPTEVETHSAEDVVVWADGPQAHLLNGVHEQNYIAHVMFYAACLGPNNQNHPHCPSEEQTSNAEDAAGELMAELDKNKKLIHEQIY